MFRLVKDVFGELCSQLDTGPALAKAITRYRLAFINKNAEHIAFFGGNLLGVQRVRFADQDRALWFDEIIQQDEHELTPLLHALPGINPEYIVSSDVFNLSAAWLLHALWNSKKLNASAKHEAMVEVAMIMQYKFYTSRLVRHFEHPSDPEVAEAMYANLSYKHDIKRAGSWDVMFRNRAEDIVGDNGLHKQTIRTMSDDAKVVYFLNDTQGRIREMLKVLYNEYLQTRYQGEKIVSQNAVVEHDGEMMLRDRKGGIATYRNYIESVIGDRNSFIKLELLEVIYSAMPTMSPQLFTTTLNWMSDHYSQAQGNEISQVLSETIVHMFDYFTKNPKTIRNRSDIPAILTRLRGVYTSSRNSDPALLALRTLTEKLVKEATHNRNKSAVASCRTGILLYIVLRTVCKNHYGGH